jgi:hypothetical protein
MRLRRWRQGAPPGHATRVVGPLLDLPRDASGDAKDRVTQALVRILVRQIRSELGKENVS